MIDWTIVGSIIIGMGLWKLTDALGAWIYEVIKEG